MIGMINFKLKWYYLLDEHIKMYKFCQMIWLISSNYYVDIIVNFCKYFNITFSFFRTEKKYLARKHGKIIFFVFCWYSLGSVLLRVSGKEIQESSSKDVYDVYDIQHGIL